MKKINIQKRILAIICIFSLLLPYATFGGTVKVDTVGDLMHHIKEDGQVLDVYQRTYTITPPPPPEPPTPYTGPMISGGGGGGPQYRVEVDEKTNQFTLVPILQNELPYPNITEKDSEKGEMILYDDELMHRYSYMNFNKDQEEGNSVQVEAHINHGENCDSEATAIVNYKVVDNTDYNALGYIIKPSIDDNVNIDLSGEASEEGTTTLLDKFNKWFNGHKDIQANGISLYPGLNTPEIINELTAYLGANESYTPKQYKAGEENKVYEINRDIHTDMNYILSCDKCDANGTVSVLYEPEKKKLNSGKYTIKNFWGNANVGQTMGIDDGLADTVKEFDKQYGGTNTYSNQYYTTANQYLSFYPYVKYRYNTAENQTFREANITATNRSKINENITVRTTAQGASEPTILINTQWIGHSKPMEILTNKGIEDKESVIAGGSVISMKTNNTFGNITNNITENVPANNLLIESYITCVPDDMKAKMYQCTYNTSEALIELDKFKNQVKNVFDNYFIEKWVATGIYTDEKQFKENAICVSGYNQTNEYEGIPLNRTGKYYLDKNQGKITSKIDNEKIDIYTVTADTNGDLHLYKNNQYINSIPHNLINSSWNNQIINNIIDTTGEWYKVNEDTKIIDNMIQGLDRNLGYAGREGGYYGWYNEGIQGISVIKQSLDVSLNLENIQIDVEDPALNGTKDNSYDIWSEDNNKWRTLQYRLSNNAYINNSFTGDGFIGSLCNQNIIVNNINDLLKSKLFYVGNGTVEDMGN